MNKNEFEMSNQNTPEAETVSELKPLLCKQKIKVLNLYAGIGGNRKLWEGVDVTAVEMNPGIAKVYQDNFPDDTVVIGDAHEYLLKNYKEFDFIWSSPPCPTHSNARYWGSKGGMYDVMYPDMKLYQEIIFLDKFFDGKWVVENVKPYYKPLIPATEMSRHLFWSNFKIPKAEHESNYIHNGADKKRVEKLIGIDVTGYGVDTTKVLRNCVHPEIGKHILDRVRGIEESEQIEQGTLFA